MDNFFLISFICVMVFGICKGFINDDWDWLVLGFAGWLFIGGFVQFIFPNIY